MCNSGDGTERPFYKHIHRSDYAGWNPLKGVTILRSEVRDPKYGLFILR